MPRNLIICCDGTNNQFGPENTNVVRLVQVLERDPARQHLYYDPGVGTLPEPGWLTRWGRRLSEISGLAFGTGLTEKVGRAYSFLMDYWEPGDKVFLFGFSRGAYTVRVLAALLHSLGLLPHGNHNLVPYAIRLFKAVRGRGAPAEAAEESNYWKLCNEFRWTFARRVTPEDDTRRFRVHYLGVWDTVSSVGWVWDPLKFPYTAANPSIAVIRHAVSVDERRWFFRQNLMQPKGGQDFLELWFPGVHADVGGGYPERDGGLWRTPFNWILTEAVRAGLRVDEQRLQKVLHRSEPSAKPWTDNQHESLRGLWWLAEFFPKVHWHPDRACWSPDIGRGRRRYVPDHALMHKTTLLRIRERADYAPPNLSRAFLEKVRGLGEVPETMPYER